MSLSFQWHAMLVLAQDLHQSAQHSLDSEARLRTAIGRAYFSVFCHVRDFAQRQLGFQPTAHVDDHGRLRSILRGKLKNIGDRLDRLRQWRNPADYIQELPWDPTVVAPTALQVAKSVFDALPLPTLPSN